MTYSLQNNDATENARNYIEAKVEDLGLNVDNDALPTARMLTNVNDQTDKLDYHNDKINYHKSKIEYHEDRDGEYHEDKVAYHQNKIDYHVNKIEYILNR